MVDVAWDALVGESAAWRAMMAVLVGSTTVWLYRETDRLNRKKRLSVDAKGNPRKLRDLPRVPNELPFLGNGLEIARNGRRIYEWTVEYCEKFNSEPWVRNFFGMDMICFSTPEAIEEITTTQFDHFVKGKFQTDVIEDVAGRGVFTADGERWYRQRKTAVKFFTAKSLRAFMMKGMDRNIGQMCQVLEDGAKNDEWVDLKKLFQEFTLQSFVEMALGLEFAWIGTKERHAFYEAMDAVPLLQVDRFRQPVWMWKLQRFLNIGREAKLAKEMHTIREWLQDMVKEGLAKLNEIPGETGGPEAEEAVKSVLELFVEQSDKYVDGLQSEDLIDFLLTFMFASRDTTALMLTWLLYVLGQHPHVTKAIRDELKRKLPGQAGRKDAFLTTEHTRHLVYLEAAIREVLRLYPAAPTNMRKVANDTVVGGDIPLYEGQIVLISAYAMARNRDVWGPDAREFKPERWIDEKTGELIQVPSTKFIVFSTGPRTCIGKHLALLQLRVVTANLLNRFDFEIDPANDGSHEPSTLLMMKHALKAKIHPASF
ncbi:hypothetical protein Poli38472_008232 [Pythium oligandrum]|uniref:Cytochrome P450 n=1 Tax=Pythium oligandrum TaxID=41045 RepID=A0A8K1CLR5_PYTOL|nr:hypothetical protein Poli38472_008232 [Pythium oligandrum]|eukprot:TMW65590.1 hypothetical protein Poli38472_008232 [Pythium oligandrum]